MGVTGVILAGGKSLRFGREKAFVRLNNKSLIEWTINSLSRVSESILIVTSLERNESLLQAQYAGEVIVDLWSGKAALGGIYTGLNYANTVYSVVVGCDMPFLSRDLLNYQISLASDFDAIVLRINDKIEPLHSVYSKSCLPSIEKLFRKKTLSIAQLFTMVKTRYVNEEEIAQYDPECLSVFNVNTQKDLTIARVLARKMELLGND